MMFEDERGVCVFYISFLFLFYFSCYIYICPGIFLIHLHTYFLFYTQLQLHDRIERCGQSIFRM